MIVKVCSAVDVLIFIAWLRKHCTEVFHFLAHELKDEPLFETSVHDGEYADKGAMYNDVDHNPIDLLHGGENNLFSFSQTNNFKSAHPVQALDMVKEGVECAVLEAHRTESVAYQDLIFDTDCFNIKIEVTDHVYMQKVYCIVTREAAAWENLKLLSRR